MKINLLEAMKTRFFDELEETISRNILYKDKVKVYHKFPYRERPSSGVVLKNISFNRLKLSPDDYVGMLRSHFASARAGEHPGEFLEWVWEDQINTTKRVTEDVSIQANGSNRDFVLSNKGITQGPGNVALANNFRNIDLFIDGIRSYPENIQAESGIVRLSKAPISGSKIEIGYFYSNMAKPGRYYLEIVKDGPAMRYVVNPLCSVTKELVIDNARGNEPGGTLKSTPVMVDFVSLYLVKKGTDYRVKLLKDQEYTVDSSGSINFINGFSMASGISLEASYRWVAEEVGPIDIPKKGMYDNETIPGASLAFNDRIKEGDKAVVIVYPQREIAAHVYGGHYSMSLDIEVFTMDTVQLPGMVDYIVNDLWDEKRIPLMSEGITIEELDSSGETEDVYDENTGDMYYKNSLSMTIMTEWKRFVPILYEVSDFRVSQGYIDIKSENFGHLYTGRDLILENDIRPKSDPFTVQLYTAGYPRIS